MSDGCPRQCLDAPIHTYACLAVGQLSQLSRLRAAGRLSHKPNQTTNMHTHLLWYPSIPCRVYPVESMPYPFFARCAASVCLFPSPPLPACLSVKPWAPSLQPLSILSSIHPSIPPTSMHRPVSEGQSVSQSVMDGLNSGAHIPSHHITYTRVLTHKAYERWMGIRICM